MPAAKSKAILSSFPVSHETLRGALQKSVLLSGGPSNGGLDNHMWAVVVDREATVLAVCYSGNEPGDQWPGSRAIAIAKANTANAFSLPQSALSTANLYSGAQPGGFLYGIFSGNPVHGSTVYDGDSATYGTQCDPMVGRKASGTIVFGGGLALYDGKTIIGALGVSGDTSCADHNVAWRIRTALKLDHVPAGITKQNNDAIIYDFGLLGKSSSGYGHPETGLNESKIAKEIGASGDGK